jgi:PIN domain nuclease of toxin-antitoxin system
VLVEIGLLYERGRLRVGPVQILEALGRHPSYSVMGLDVEQAVEFATLTAIRDPMDRLILAAARVTGSRLLSADEALGGHGVERLWD